MTDAEVHSKLVLWLNGLLGVPVIQDRQQGTRPALPYAMVSLANWGELDQNVTDIAYSDGPNDTVLAIPENEVEWVFLFFAYGEAGGSLLSRLYQAIHLTQAQEPLYPDLVIHEIGRANTVPEFLGEVWEPRVQANIVLRGKSSGGAVAVDTIAEPHFNIERA